MGLKEREIYQKLKLVNIMEKWGIETKLHQAKKIPSCFFINPSCYDFIMKKSINNIKQLCKYTHHQNQTFQIQ